LTNNSAQYFARESTTKRHKDKKQKAPKPKSKTSKIKIWKMVLFFMTPVTAIPKSKKRKKEKDGQHL